MLTSDCVPGWKAGIPSHLLGHLTLRDLIKKTSFWFAPDWCSSCRQKNRRKILLCRAWFFRWFEYSRDTCLGPNTKVALSPHPLSHLLLLSVCLPMWHHFFQWRLHEGGWELKFGNTLGLPVKWLVTSGSQNDNYQFILQMIFWAQPQKCIQIVYWEWKIISMIDGLRPVVELVFICFHLRNDVFYAINMLCQFSPSLIHNDQT